MAESAKRIESLRLNRRETGRLVLALALSLAAHLFVWGGYEAGKRLDLWRLMPRLAWLLPKPKISPPTQKQEPPLEFVMVEQPSTTAPDKAKFYGAQNSRAANPDAARDMNIPKLNGTQTEVPKTETVTKPDFNKLQPAPRPANSEPEQPTPTVQPGDLSLGKPQEQTPPRPRTLSQARAQSHSPGVEMKQIGGVHQVALSPSFDVKATTFGQYDSEFVDAVTYRWYSLLDSQQFALDRTGKVTLRFHLNYDGTITDMTVLQNTVGDLLGYVCQKAINDPAPFKPWPEEMHREIGKNSREITFTFYYY